MSRLFSSEQPLLGELAGRWFWNGTEFQRDRRLNRERRVRNKADEYRARESENEWPIVDVDPVTIPPNGDVVDSSSTTNIQHATANVRSRSAAARSPKQGSPTW